MVSRTKYLLYLAQNNKIVDNSKEIENFTDNSNDLSQVTTMDVVTAEEEERRRCDAEMNKNSRLTDNSKETENSCQVTIMDVATVEGDTRERCDAELSINYDKSHFTELAAVMRHSVEKTVNSGSTILKESKETAIKDSVEIYEQPFSTNSSSESESIVYNSESDPEFILFEEELAEESDDSIISDIKEFTATVPPNKSPILQDAEVSQSSDKCTNDSESVKSTCDVPCAVETAKKKNYTDRRDYCFFCDKDVSHFARHIFTWHEEEIEVLKIMSYKVNSKERRKAICELKKKGNFIRNTSTENLRPVKRLKEGDNSNRDDFLPCQYCYGFYKKKSLYRHTRVCSANSDLGKTKKRQTSQSDGQTTLLLHTNVKHCELLRAKLFPRMRADEICFIAKKDSLICAYAYSYMKGRRSKGNIDLVRQNVRRLAKLLKFVRQQNQTVKKFIDILNPAFFHIIIDGVNSIAGYNNDTETYESPTVAMNFGTLLKKCCDLAVIQLLQKDNAEKQREQVKTLKTLIESQWANEVSAQASTDLHENKWNKQELLPLTSDLKLFNTFLKNVANDSYETLCKNEKCIKAYNKLKEVLYTQIIVLNRRRPAEVAQLKTQTYKSIHTNVDSVEKNEFQSCLTETEKILLKTYSRIVIRGKRGRGVPVLLSPDMKKHLDLLLKVRHNFVNGKNDYVFHTSGQGFIDGTKILQKYATVSGLQRPKSVTANKLRKHLATISQLLQFSDNDMEQLTKFMGHTLKTHCSVYRISDNMYQTAKVSKLLLLMQDGGAEQFKGKTLDEIDIDLDPITENVDFVQESLENVNVEDFNTEENASDENEFNKTKEKLVEKKRKKIKKKKETYKEIVRQPWSSQEKLIISTYFKKHIKEKRAPKIGEVTEFMKKHPDIVQDRKWTSIKATVYNIYTGKLKVPI